MKSWKMEYVERYNGWEGYLGREKEGKDGGMVMMID